MKDITAARTVRDWMHAHHAVTLRVDDENDPPSRADSYVDSTGATHNLDDQDLNDHVAWLPGAVISNATAPTDRRAAAFAGWNPVVTRADLQAWLDLNEAVEFWPVFPDVQNSYELAMREVGIAPDVITAITTTVSDYAANHYGDN